MLLVMNLEIIFCIVSVWCVVSNSSLAVPVDEQFADGSSDQIV
jgi:hypothetical protein